MFYLVYKIVNNVNGKSYIGCHKTTNKEDNYMGSGVLIKKAIEKYGIENFEKHILIECSSAEEMFEKEYELVEISEHSYNLNKGGHGGWAHVNATGKNKNFDLAVYRETDEYKESVLRGYKNGIGKDSFVKPKFNGNEFTGKKHTEKSKREIGRKNSINQEGKKNSQFGTMWVTNGKESLKINKNDSIPDGYRKGRVIKKVI